MSDEDLTICELGLMELGLCRLAFAPDDSRSEYGVGAYGPRYAYVGDVTDVALIDREDEVAGQLNMEIEKGATFTYSVRWRNVDNTPVDVTDCAALLQIRKTKSTTGEHVLSVANYSQPVDGPSPWRVDLTVDGPAGRFDISLVPSVTAALEAGEWFYDLKVTLVGGEVHRIVEGRVTVDPGVSA